MRDSYQEGGLSADGRLKPTGSRRVNHPRKCLFRYGICPKWAPSVTVLDIRGRASIQFWSMENSSLIETLFQLMKFFVPFLFALSFHEFAHGVVARMRGDRTAEIMGRLTLNPFAHADPLGTVFLPIVGFLTHAPLFGWAKPVPVDERNLKSPRTDMFWIAFAGPLSNLFLACVTAVVIVFFIRFNAEGIVNRQQGLLEIFDVLQKFVLLNVYLAVFNLLPIHPLDGGKIIARFLPENVNRKLEEMQTYTSMLLLVLFISGGAAIISGPAQWLSSWLMGTAMNASGVM